MSTAGKPENQQPSVNPEAGSAAPDAEPRRSALEKEFSRRALLAAGWIAPVIVAATPLNTLGDTGSPGAHGDTPGIEHTDDGVHSDTQAVPHSDGATHDDTP